MAAKTSLIVVFFLLPLTYFAIAQQAPYQITAFDEDLSANVEVSGTIMASYLVKGKLNHASADALFIYVVPERPKLNASIVSIDGKYSADLSLIHNSTSAGWVQIQFPSKFKRDLQAYAANELVAYIFADGKDKFGYYIQEVFPSSWGEPVGESKSILINSAGFEPEYSYKNDEGDTVIGSCKKIENKLSRAFNHSCEFSLKTAEQPTLVIIKTTPDGAGKKFLVWGGI